MAQKEKPISLRDAWNMPFVRKVIIGYLIVMVIIIPLGALYPTDKIEIERDTLYYLGRTDEAVKLDQQAGWLISVKRPPIGRTPGKDLNSDFNSIKRSFPNYKNGIFLRVYEVDKNESHQKTWEATVSRLSKANLGQYLEGGSLTYKDSINKIYTTWFLPNKNSKYLEEIKRTIEEVEGIDKVLSYRIP